MADPTQDVLATERDRLLSRLAWLRREHGGHLPSEVEWLVSGPAFDRLRADLARETR